VPYFVSGPASRGLNNNNVVVVGVILHVAAWLLAIVFDSVTMTHINEKDHSEAHTFWVTSYLALWFALGLLLLTTILHLLSYLTWISKDYAIEEGRAPPWLMTIMIGGAQSSMILSLLSILTVNEVGFWMPNATATAEEQTDETANFRQLAMLSIVAKIYIVAFLKNNQDCVFWCLEPPNPPEPPEPSKTATPPVGITRMRLAFFQQGRARQRHSPNKPRQSTRYEI